MNRLRQILILCCMIFMIASCSTPEGKAKKELKAKGIEPTASALVSQAGAGNAENVMLLLEAGVPVNAPGQMGHPALAEAASSGRTAVITVLLNAGADKDMQEKNGDTALLRAVKAGQTASALVLLKAGARSDIKNNTDNSALDIAIEEQNWQLITALGQAGASLDGPVENGRTLLLEAMRSEGEEKELAKALIEGGANCNIADINGNTPFTEAVKHNIYTIIPLMAKKGADIDGVLFRNKTYTALMEAITNNRPELVKTLIEAGADVNFKVEETQDSCLFRAVFTKQKDMVEMLIKAGADVNTQNNFLETPLSRATADISGKNLEIAEILVQAGADVNAVVSEKGHTPAHITVLNGDRLLDSLRFLLDKGASADIYDNDGQTPLTLAIMHQNAGAVNVLIEGGANVNFPAMNGQMPFYTAEKLENRKISILLRKAGATK